jgi:cell division protein FtsL
MNTRTAALGSGGWFLFTLMALMFSIIMGMAVTWINVGSRSIATDIHKMQCQTVDARNHIAKLEVERDSLLSPYILGKTAERLGMAMADPGQIRRIEASRRN